MTRCALAQNIGFDQGNQLPDLVYETPNGTQESLSQQRGKIVFFHVLASWCPPCGPELKTIDHLYSALSDEPGIEFVVCGWRENHQRTMAWAKYQWNVSVPINHTGSNWKRNRALEFENGLTHRSGVPQTWILGPDGIVIAHQNGTYWDWEKHIDALRAAAREVAEGQSATLSLPSE